MTSTQFGFNRSNLDRKIRVVAKIRGFSDPDSNNGSSRTVDWVSVNRANFGDVTISFKEQSSSQYSVDNCYNEHEDNEIIFSKEVKPLVLAAFEGINSTVIAHGARGSGKTHLIQGSFERPGLAVLATSEFLSMAEKNGKSIAVSFYDVDHQDRAVDLLNPEQPPILLFEDRGRIQFKGLTQTPVKSIAEFQNLYNTASSAHNAAPKKGFERACRSHMGLIVHVLSQNESIDGLASKINFVDMAGYEDARRKSVDVSELAENKKINKSIYALLNVCHALSTNESRVPYRESKLTRMLQDSLRGTGKILLVSCLNPSFCQDTVYMVSLASRSCQWIHQTPLDSTKKSESSTRQTMKLDSTNKSASSARHTVTLDSSTKNASSTRQTVNLGSTKKSTTLARNTVTLDSTKKSTTLARNTVTLDSTKKSASLIKQTAAVHSTKKSTTLARNTVTLDSTKKSASLTNQTPTPALHSTKKIACSARQTVASDSTKKNASSAMQMVTIRKNKKPTSVSATIKKLPGSMSNISEKKGVIAMKSAIKGRKLFDEASHSAAKAEKENFIANITKASELLLENSISEDGNDVQVNSRIDKETFIVNGTKASDPLLDNSLSEDGNHVELNSRIEKGDLSLNASSEVELDPIVEKGISEDKEDHNEIHSLYAINYSKDQSIVDEGHNMNKENNNLMENEDCCSPPISSQLRELQSFVSSPSLCMQLEEKSCIFSLDQISTKIGEPRTPDIERQEVMNTKSPWETFNMHGSGMKYSLVKDYLRILNTAEKDELKKLKGIGEKRATYILELREESPEPFKSLDDLMDIGLSEKQIKGMMRKEVGELFTK